MLRPQESPSNDVLQGLGPQHTHPVPGWKTDGADILWRERAGIRLVIFTNPTPNTGAKLVKTVYRVEARRPRQGEYHQHITVISF
jgi:hypothetical protein